MRPETRRFGFLLFDNYPALPVAAMMDVLRDTAYVTGHYDYDWCTIGSGSNTVTAMNRLHTVTDFTLETAPPLDAVVVCSGLNGHLAAPVEHAQCFHRGHRDRAMDAGPGRPAG